MLRKVRAAIIYSLVDTCKSRGVAPREWMKDVLLRIPGKENNREALRKLLPDKWAKKSNYNQLEPTWPSCLQLEIKLSSRLGSDFHHFYQMNWSVIAPRMLLGLF